MKKKTPSVLLSSKGIPKDLAEKQRMGAKKEGNHFFQENKGTRKYHLSFNQTGPQDEPCHKRKGKKR